MVRKASWLTRTLTGLRGWVGGTRGAREDRHRFRPRLEGLDHRIMPATYYWAYLLDGYGEYDWAPNWRDSNGDRVNTFPGTTDSIVLPDETSGIDLSALGSCAGITMGSGWTHAIKGSLTVNGDADIENCSWNIKGHLSVSGNVTLTNTNFYDSPTTSGDGIAFCTDGFPKWCSVNGSNLVTLNFGEALRNHGEMKMQWTMTNGNASITTSNNNTPTLFRNDGTLNQYNGSTLGMPVDNYGIIQLGGDVANSSTQTGWIKNFGTVVVAARTTATVGGPGANTIPTGDLFVPQADFVNYAAGTNGSTNPGRIYVYGGATLTCSHGIFSSGSLTGIGSIYNTAAVGNQTAKIVGNVALYNSSLTADYWYGGTTTDQFVVNGNGKANIDWIIDGTLTTEGALTTSSGSAIDFNYDSGRVNLLTCTTIQFSDSCALVCTRVVGTPPLNTQWKVIQATNSVVHNGDATLGQPGAPFAGSSEDTTNKAFYVYTFKTPPMEE